MTTAREIITSTLTFHLNGLAPGETLDNDLAALCLSGLNDIADEWSGSSQFLWRESLESAEITGQTLTVGGADYPNISPGQSLLGITYNARFGDVPVRQVTLQQYHEAIAIKSLVGGYPMYWAYDGESTVYLYPQANGQQIKIRVNRAVDEFDDLDSPHVLPQGYKSALAAILAERVAPSVLGGIPPAVAVAARRARRNIGAQVAAPGIISSPSMAGNILSGWR